MKDGRGHKIEVQLEKFESSTSADISNKTAPFAGSLPRRFKAVVLYLFRHKVHRYDIDSVYVPKLVL
jgi:hypothetical protein